MTFFAELKRRNVFRVAASYAIVAWIVLQVADTAFPRLNIPDWVVSFLLVLLLLGFPLALFLAWAYEMTPDGIKLTKDVTLEESVRAHTGQKMNYLIIGGLAVLLLLVVVDDYVLDADFVTTLASAETAPVEAPVADTSAALPEKSVAVLPFENISDDTEQEYFSDGLTEELINKLSQVDGLLVTGRNSSFFYKDQEPDLKDVGATLGVAHVVQGSVRKAGSTVRISAQLTDVNTNANLWSATYDRDLTDLFAVQDEIAEAITTALSITISVGEFSQPGMTSSIEAYDEFLQARTLAAMFTAESIPGAIDHIERAVFLDPKFTQAWLMMSRLYGGAGRMLPPAASANFPARSNEALAKVRELAPDLPDLKLRDAMTSLGPFQFAAAEDLFLEAIESTNNSNAALARAYAGFLAFTGRTQSALAYSQQARRLDPLDAGAPLQLATILITLGRYEEALAEIDRALSLEGLDESLLGLKFTAAVQVGDRAAALQALEAMPIPRPVQIETARYWVDGDIESALALVRDNYVSENNSPARRGVFGQFAIAMGYPQMVLDTVKNGSNAALPGPWMPYFSEARKLPDFKEWVRAQGLVDYWRTTGNWADKCRPVNDDFECF